MENRIQLVMPKQDIGKSFTSGQWWPHGLLSIATYCKQKNPALDIEVLDGEIETQNTLEQKIREGNSGIIGISCNSFNYVNGLKLGKLAKSLNKKVYFGGSHSSALADKILKKRSFIDAIVKYDGEEAFYDLIRNKTPKEISNLVYRKKGKIISNNVVLKHLYQNLQLDFSLIDLKKYQTNHSQAYPFLSKGTMLYFTHVGCKWREVSGGCIFCAISEPKQRYQDVTKIWTDLRRFKKQYGIKLVKDYGDTFTANRQFVKSLLDKRPKDLEDISFLVYGSSKDITKEMADMLEVLNVRYVFVGFESGNDQILKNLNKGTTAKKNFGAAKRLMDRGIGIFASYIMGCPGETRETMKNTYNLAEEIANYGEGKGSGGRNLVELSNASPFIPLPGSKIFSDLFGNGDDDIFDPKKSIKYFIKEKCNLGINPETSYDLIINECNKISDLSLQKNYLGWTK